MRSDSILNTGMTSASLNKAERAQEARQQRKKLKEQKRSQLLPSAEIVVAELNKEQESVKLQLLKLVNPATPKEDVKELIVALNIYDQSISNLKTRLSNILRKVSDDREED